MRIHSEDKENLSVLGAERESESNAEVESNDEGKFNGVLDSFQCSGCSLRSNLLHHSGASQKW